MAVATWQQVAVALGRPTTDFNADQQAQITWWLNGVERFIINRLGPIADLNQEDVIYVEVEAVVAKLDRAKTSGASSITVNVDDGGVTRRFESAVSASDITDDWWNLLSPNADSSAWSTRPSFEPDCAAWPAGYAGYPYYWVAP